MLESDKIQYGIGVPYGEVAKTAEEAEVIAKKIGMHLACKGH